jgi:hypothetical protein
VYELVQALNQDGRSAVLASRVANACVRLEDFDPKDEWGLESETNLEILGGTGSMYQRSWPEVFAAGHRVLCSLFRLFPLRLVPHPAGMIELPERKTHTLLPELMFMLRRDYEAGRKLSFCANDDCRNAFLVTRSDQSCCSEVCARRVRQRRYWRLHGRKRREMRLKTK